ncbi:kojibiose phosphorylase [Nocardioides sp. Root190]|uniref:glycoside hydrolase family 65 protein n=1 Tax=Nocardioides sp. Root190 TaxID=1736488 RepID=UPI0006F86E37|nr:glycosyl hydrolase family 65 protein [Nocardioides sp. Root190]KRB78925.1 kojibiose phosphorylase [Nocardioides sp. Root190]
MNAHDGPGPSHKAPPAADPLDRTRFPIDEWRLVETRFDGDDLGTTESLFTVGNGYLGLRGNYSESRDAHVDGTFINGFHETWPISHAEEAYGFARIGQTIVNVPDPKVIRLYVDDEPLQVSAADLLDYERSLDFRTGVLTRELLWRTPGGKRVQIRSTRMVPLEQRHLAILTFEVTLLDQRASLAISSQLINRQDVEREAPNGSGGGGGEAGADPRKAEMFDRRVLVPRLHGADPDTGRIKLGYRTAESGMTLGVVADHTLETTAHHTMDVHSEDDMAKVMYRISAEPGVPVKLTKIVAFHTAQTVPPRELIDRCERTVDRTHEEGIARQYSSQEAWLKDFWERADVQVADQPALQQAIRWNLFSILQASARAEGQGIAAKGVSGSGYGGHYFWDTEIYVMPFLTYTLPSVARNALRFRYNLLDNARHRARELSQKGALFPWRTINGHEASAYYAAGTAQYHIDADIAYALSQYVGATGDEEFLAREAVDIFVETARLWADLGFWRDEGDGGDNGRTFHIHGVTGPDEYTTVVNDNLYTNVLARFNLRRAARAVWELERDDPAAYDGLVRRTGLTVDEPQEWADAAQAMAITYDDFLGIHPQDAHFLEREMWDLENTPLDKRPLLLNYHPLVIYRFQVLKQADVVLALFLQGEEFTPEQKKADFDYYDPITTGDSTLSAVMQSIMAAEVGYHELAVRYFVSALFVDLADRHNNTADGLHVASTGGVWSALVSGFGGFRDIGSAAGDEQWQIDPRLPDGWPSLTYRVTLHGARLRVIVRPDELELALEHDPGSGPITVSVRGQQVVVADGAPVTVPLEHQGPRLEGEPPYPAGIQRADGTVISAIVPSGD